jgi:hypothetical protein
VAKSSSQVFLGGISGHLQDFVIVTLGHILMLRTRPRLPRGAPDASH